MISTAYIKEWKQHAPWTRNDQVEQDLIICRANHGTAKRVGKIRLS